MEWFYQLVSSFSRSDWISITGIIVSSITAVLLFRLSRRVNTQQKLQRQHDIQDQLHSSIGHDIEIYNVRLYNKRYFYKNISDVFRGYCYLGSAVRGYGIDGVELLYYRESWADDLSVECVGVLPYEWIEYIKEGGDGSTNKTILFVKAPWFKFPYRKTTYYRYGRKGTNAITDEYHRLVKPASVRVKQDVERVWRKLRYVLWLRWKRKGK